MTIEEIVERELARQGSFTHRETNLNQKLDRELMSVECARAACLAIAKAIAEECAKEIEDIKFHAGIVGDHQPSKWRNAAIEMAQEKIRALTTPRAPGGEKR